MPARHQQQPALACERDDARGCVGRAGSFVTRSVDELDARSSARCRAPRRSAAAGARDLVGAARAGARRSRGRPRGTPGSLDLVERHEAGGAGERVAAERAAEPADVRRVHQLGTARDARQRQAAAERLAPDDRGRARRPASGRRRARCPSGPCRSAPRRRCRRCRARGRSRIRPSTKPGVAGRKPPSPCTGS